MTPARLPRLRTRLSAPLLLAACLATPALAEPAAFGGPKELIHGNYCGPGNNAPLPPIDALDAACARHDACTPAHGLPSQACNLRFKSEAEAISRDPRQPEDVRTMAGLAAAIATMIPSDNRQPVVAVFGTYAPPPGTVYTSGPAPGADNDE